MARNLIETLKGIDGGKLVEDFQEQLQALNLAVDGTGKGGTVTLTIAIKPAGKDRVSVGYDVKAKMPAHPRETTIMWGSPEGDLLAEDPRQQKLDLKTPTVAPVQPLREVPQVGNGTK